MLSHRDVEQVLESLRVNNERISRKAGYPFPLEIAQLNFLTEPARQIKKRTLVTPCGEFTNSKEQAGVQLAQRVEPNSTVGTIVSMRVFEFESVYRLNMLLPSTKNEQ